MWALWGSYYPRRSRRQHIVIVAGEANPCSVFAMEGRIVGHIGDVGLDEPTSRNLLASVCQYVTDAMAVVDLIPYTFVIDEWKSAPSAEMTVEIMTNDNMSGYFYHNVFETAKGNYTVFAKDRYNFPDLVYQTDPTGIVLDVAFRKAMFFISSALRYPDHTASFCINAIESLRAAFGDGSSPPKRRQAWAAMHAALQTEQLTRVVCSEDHQSERHGHVIPRTWLERAEVLAPTIEIAYRYGLRLAT